MPNIEIHGFLKKEAESLRRRVFDVFDNTPYVDEMVVTIYSTDVKNKDNKDQPFFRLIAIPRDYIHQIMERLHRLDVDVEQLELKDFIPKYPK